jgi:hypothetical protein
VRHRLLFLGRFARAQSQCDNRSDRLAPVTLASDEWIGNKGQRRRKRAVVGLIRFIGHRVGMNHRQAKMNKGARDFNRWKSCARKRAFETPEAAFQKGQSAYQCNYCGKWHRSGALAKLVAAVSKIKRRPPGQRKGNRIPSRRSNLFTPASIGNRSLGAVLADERRVCTDKSPVQGWKALVPERH